MDYSHLSQAEIRKGIEETAAALAGVRRYQEFIATGKGLPRDETARAELAQSYAKIRSKLEGDLDDLFRAARTVE
jgi:hypothetical protein